MGERARLLVQDSLRWHIDTFCACKFFFQDFVKKALRWLFQTSSIPSPPSPIPGLVPKSPWRKTLLQMLWRLSAKEALRSGCKLQKGRAHVSLLLIAYKFAVFMLGSFYSCERGFKNSLTCSSRFGRSKGSSCCPIVEWIILNTYVTFVTKSRFIHLIYRFYYNASVNSHSQLSAYSKETHKCPIVSTWNSAIYGVIKHVPHSRIHVCLVMCR